MNAKQELKQRHLQAVGVLQKTANPITSSEGLVKCSKIVSKNLGVSPQTVMNYLLGRGKDGYLTEAITTQFKTLKFNSNE